ncbi:MAG: hypothetical protein ACFBRM_00440 [Pikeienuella sp.]
MATTELHPSELAYAFAYAKADEIIGWGMEPFLPPSEGAGDPTEWLSTGEERLIAGGRLLGKPGSGLNFAESLSSAVLALVDPGVVLLAQRKEEDGVRTLTVHAAGVDFIGLTCRPDGTFEMIRYAELTAAAGACSSFVGAALAPLESEARIETNHQLLSKLQQLAAAGREDKLVGALVKLGAAKADAASAARALADPAVAGVVSVLYCANNEVQDAETFTVLTTAEDDTWIVFPPAEIDGPMVLERCSVSALTARIAVGIAARLAPTG